MFDNQRNKSRNGLGIDLLQIIIITINPDLQQFPYEIDVKNMKLTRILFQILRKNLPLVKYHHQSYQNIPIRSWPRKSTDICLEYLQTKQLSV